MKNLMILRLVLFISIYTFIAFPVLGAQELEKAPKIIPELEQEIKKICEEYNIPGATIALVSKDSIIWAGGVGKSDVAAGNNVESKTIFRWGSISKSFVSVGILMLVERGLIHLDDKIRDIKFSTVTAIIHFIIVLVLQLIMGIFRLTILNNNIKLLTWRPWSPYTI